MSSDKIVILKYNAGNIQSVLYAMERIGVEAVVTDDPTLIRDADKVIFPGVGEASSAMAYLRERGLDQLIRDLRQPFLGICLGMQLMCEHSEEGDTDCLAVFNHKVKKFTAADGSAVSGPGVQPGSPAHQKIAQPGSPAQLKIPQVGWNQVLARPGELLFEGLPASSNFYFVHSYYAGEGAETAATTGYGLQFSSALRKNNFYGVQFHPEKSAEAGERLLLNFINS